jgi:hypothetical protein
LVIVLVATTIESLYFRLLGAIFFTVKIKLAVVIPPLLIPTTVNTVGGKVAVGIPLIVPVVVFKLTPVGKLGVIPKLEIESPEYVTELLMLVIVLVAITIESLYFKLLGAILLTLSLKLAVVLPPLLVPVMVNTVGGNINVGIPLIIPVSESNSAKQTINILIAKHY